MQSRVSYSAMKSPESWREPSREASVRPNRPTCACPQKPASTTAILGWLLQMSQISRNECRHTPVASVATVNVPQGNSVVAATGEAS
jgi:hypothetical protein